MKKVILWWVGLNVLSYFLFLTTFLMFPWTYQWALGALQ